MNNVFTPTEAAAIVQVSTKRVYKELEYAIVCKIAGLRDILAHTYFQVEDKIIWDVVQSKIQTLLQQVRQLLEQEF
ncbi:MAG: DUF86 domain-containing protein [Richelia sp. RM2_1_2]|nr:DUF86 domain-containing protein [Richelia sp. RM2_1_2]